jgi:hypothetical protein
MLTGLFINKINRINLQLIFLKKIIIKNFWKIFL